MEITYDALMALIEGTSSARIEVEARLEKLRAEVAKLELQGENLLLEARAYELALRRLFPSEAPEVEPEIVSSGHQARAEAVLELASMNRTAAVEHAVRTLTSGGETTTSPADIEGMLSAGGRDDTRDQIGAALAYLNKRNIVERASRARWRIRGTEGIDDPQT